MKDKTTNRKNPMLKFKCDVCNQNKARCVYGGVSYCLKCRAEELDETH